jgi:hypothetical protein
MPEGVGTDGIGYGVDHPVFWIDRYHPHSVRQHTAFAAKAGPRLTRSPIIAHIVTIALWRRISGSASDISAASSLVSLRKPPPGG